jgi:ATP-dependent protease HslVU (ClpYQ) peptidase subunit
MSIVVAVHKANETVVAADTLCLYGSRRETEDNLAEGRKVFRSGGHIFGSVGSCVFDVLLIDFVMKYKRLPPLKDRSAVYKFFLGFWRYLHDHCHLVKDSPPDDEESQFAALDAAFILANKHGIFTIDSDLTVMKFNKYAAIGSADRTAHGALHVLYDLHPSAEPIARAAVETAIALEHSCGGSVESHTL